MENKVDLYKLRAALEEFQKIDADLTVGDVMTFLCAADEEGLSVRDIQERLRMTQSTASRTVNKLGQHGTKGREGLELLHTAPNPQERRKVQVRLSARGRKLAMLVAAALGAWLLIDPDGADTLREPLLMVHGAKAGDQATLPRDEVFRIPTLGTEEAQAAEGLIRITN